MEQNIDFKSYFRILLQATTEKLHLHRILDSSWDNPDVSGQQGFTSRSPDSSGLQILGLI